MLINLAILQNNNKMEKIYVNAEKLLLDSFKLAKKIYDSGYRPNLIVGVWRGGSPIAMAVDEYFRHKKIKIPTYPLKSEGYDGKNHLKKEIKVSGLEVLITEIKPEDRILLVDDVLDSGKSLEKIMRTLSFLNKDVKIATVYYKPKRNKTRIKPDFYLYKTNEWLVFPHELENLKLKEIKQKNSELYNILTT